MEFLSSIGLRGVLALIGCWLIVGAIIAVLPGVKQLFNRDFPLNRTYQRILAGIFGLVLLGPTLHLLYYGSASRITPPGTPDYVASPTGTAHLVGFRSDRFVLPGPAEWSPESMRGFGGAHLILASATLAPQQACRKVESFGLYAHNIRRLKYPAFRGQVYIYVGDIIKNGTNVFLFSTEASSPADGKIDDLTFQHLWSAATPLRSQVTIQNPGQFFTFPFAGAQFRLTVSQIYKVLIGNDEIVVDICEQ